jgi:hypothetical protein
MLGRVAGDYSSPTALYRAIREVHPKASKKQIAVAALAILVVSSPGRDVEPTSGKRGSREAKGDAK